MSFAAGYGKTNVDLLFEGMPRLPLEGEEIFTDKFSLCLGGGVSNQKEALLAPVKEYIDREDYARNLYNRTELKIATFRNDAGIIGAALLGVN